LLNVLYYTGLVVSENIDEDTLSFSFQEFMEKDPQNPSLFNEYCTKVANDKKFEEKVAMYRKLNNLFKADKAVSKKSNGKYYFRDTEIGEDLKQSAENLVVNKDLLDIKAEILTIE